MSTVHRDRGFANKDGDGKALTPPHTAELARTAELHRGVSEVCCRKSLCLQWDQGSWSKRSCCCCGRESCGRGCPENAYCLGPEVLLSRCSWGWLCALTLILKAPSLSLFSCPGYPALPFMAPSLLLSFPSKLLPS